MTQKPKKENLPMCCALCECKVNLTVGFFFWSLFTIRLPIQITDCLQLVYAHTWEIPDAFQNKYAGSNVVQTYLTFWLRTYRWPTSCVYAIHVSGVTQPVRTTAVKSLVWFGHKVQSETETRAELQRWYKLHARYTNHSFTSAALYQ